MKNLEIKKEILKQKIARPQKTIIETIRSKFII
jgi:hypothetical protein